MHFEVATGDVSKPRASDVVQLFSPGWDDWFKFSTLFTAYYVDKGGKRHEIGGTKIGRFGLKPARQEDPRREGYRLPNPPAEFETLPEDFFSLGQDASYYERLTAIGDEFRNEYLIAMRDLALNSELRALAEEEEVTRVSLLREVPLLTLREQFARLANGGARLTPYEFAFRFPQRSTEETPSWAAEPLALQFTVDPDSRPPSNIQVLIGRNGVGKSTLLDRLAKAMVKGPAKTADQAPAAKPRPWEQLSNLVSVSFSAFDAFEPVSLPQDRTRGLNYHYVGLKKIGTKRDNSDTKDPKALASEMTKSARQCLLGARRARWLRALRLLEADPIFADTGIADLVDEAEDIEETLDQISLTFKNLSSGHKIVLLTITRLVETVEEKSLVLLDEPEAHLHPPLLSAFVRALSDLLTNRNGMAIIATHSPVVLQEVPRTCVWKLHRAGNNLAAERPTLETFGENVGTLTDEVFGLEVTATGFHKMLTDAVQEAPDFESALGLFGGRLGAEGRAVLRALVNTLPSAHVER